MKDVEAFQQLSSVLGQGTGGCDRILDNTEAVILELQDQLDDCFKSVPIMRLVATPRPHYGILTPNRLLPDFLSGGQYADAVCADCVGTAVGHIYHDIDISSVALIHVPEGVVLVQFDPRRAATLTVLRCPACAESLAESAEVTTCRPQSSPNLVTACQQYLPSYRLAFSKAVAEKLAGNSTPPMAVMQAGLADD